MKQLDLVQQQGGRLAVQEAAAALARMKGLAGCELMARGVPVKADEVEALMRG